MRRRLDRQEDAIDKGKLTLVLVLIALGVALLLWWLPGDDTSRLNETTITPAVAAPPPVAVVESRLARRQFVFSTHAQVQSFHLPTCRPSMNVEARFLANGRPTAGPFRFSREAFCR